MCGILGIKNYNSNIDINKVSSDIIKSLINRGPDYQNYWINKDRRTAFYHTRLSILDTSNNGNQPMFSKNKRFKYYKSRNCYHFIFVIFYLSNKSLRRLNSLFIFNFVN